MPQTCSIELKCSSLVADGVHYARISGTRYQRKTLYSVDFGNEASTFEINKIYYLFYIIVFNTSVPEKGLLTVNHAWVVCFYLKN